MATATDQVTYAHDWVWYEQSDKPRWDRYQCDKCETFALFHNTYPILEQTKPTCPLEKKPPTKEAVAKYEAAQAKRKGK